MRKPDSIRINGRRRAFRASEAAASAASRCCRSYSAARSAEASASLSRAAANSPAAAAASTVQPKEPTEVTVYMNPAVDRTCCSLSSIFSAAATSLAAAAASIGLCEVLLREVTMSGGYACGRTGLVRICLPLYPWSFRTSAAELQCVGRVVQQGAGHVCSLLIQVKS